MARRQIPPAIAPPKGITGMLEGYNYEPGSVLDTSSFPDSMVLLNVYDVSDGDLIGRINKVTTVNDNILVGGVFHAGVEVFGQEWCFGVTEYGRSGVCAVLPRTHPQHNYRCTCVLGTTQLNEQDVRVLLARLSQEWPGHEYDLIHHNCISFCNALLPLLVPNGRVPGWVDRAMRTAGFIDITSKKVMEETQQKVQLVRTLSSELEEKARNLTAAEALDIAQRTSESLAGQASEHITVLGGKVQEWSESLRATAQEQAQELPPEVHEKAELVRRRTQELGDELGEKAQALGASLWQWGQGFQTKVAEQGLQATVSSLVEGGYESQPSASPPRQKIAAKGLLDEDDDDLLVGGSCPRTQGGGDAGLFRSAEESMYRQGLLAEDDEDEEEGVDLIGLAAALQDNRSHAVVEAPADWAASSSSTSASSLPVTAAADPPSSAGSQTVWDLLTPETSGIPTAVYGKTPDVDTSGYWSTTGGHPPKAADPLDGLDLLG